MKNTKHFLLFCRNLKNIIRDLKLFVTIYFIIYNTKKILKYLDKYCKLYHERKSIDYNLIVYSNIIVITKSYI